jgi:hypothetical protein
LSGAAFADELEAVSRRNLRLYGYGVKAWTPELPRGGARARR